MLIDNRIRQIMSEEYYSKRNIVGFLKEKSAKLTAQRLFMIDKISEYLRSDYWESKNDYITAVNMTDITPVDIAEEIVLLSCKHRVTSIQNVANDLGNLFTVIEDAFTRVQIASDLLAVCQGKSYELVRTDESLLFISQIKLTNETALRMSKFTYQPPMLCKPEYVSNNYQSGYITWNDTVVLGGREKSHNNPLRLDVINTLNSIPFTLDRETMLTKHKSKNKLSGDDLVNWKNYVQQQELIEQEYMDEEFYFNHKLDSRQRIYSQGYHLNYQGDEYNKALINLAKFESLEE